MIRAQSIAQQVRRIPVIKSLTSEQLKSLEGSSHRQELRSGDVLYRQGQPATSCFILLRGSIRFTVRLRRRNTIAGLAYTNDLFGLESLKSRRKRPETATAVGATAVLEVDSNLLKQFLRDNPDFQLAVLDYIVEKLNEKTAHAVQTGHYDAEQRIAAYLIDHAGETPPGQSANSTLSQADLADYLALTPETFCRKVSKFRRLGWIEGSGNEYIVKQRDALRELLDQ